MWQAGEGTAVEGVCRKAGISEATYYNWWKKYGGLMPSEMKRLKQIEEENQRLKKLVADLLLRVTGTEDPTQKGGRAFASDKAPAKPLNRYVSVQSDHLGTANAGIDREFTAPQGVRV